MDNHVKVSSVMDVIHHRSNPYFRDAIMRDGLIPKGRSEAWLTTTPIDGDVIFATNSSDIADLFDSTYDDDVYKIDTTQLSNVWYVDPNFGDDMPHMFTTEPIPLSAITLLYKGTGDSKF